MKPMNRETIKIEFCKAVAATPGWVIATAFGSSLLLLAVTIADVVKPVSVTITQESWVCTQASTDGLRAVCTEYQRRTTK